MGRDEVIEHDLRYDRADEFMEVVLGHWDAWEDDAIVQDKATRPVRRPEQGPSPRPPGPLLPLARPVHRAALAAGPSGHHPGRPERPRQALRGAMGRGDLRRLSEHRGRQARLRGVQGGRRALRPRSRARQGHAARQHRLPPRPRPRPRTNGREIEQAAARDRRAVAAVRGAQLRLREQGHGRGVHRRRDGGNVRSAGASATAWCAQRQEESDGARLHPFQRPRPGARSRSSAGRRRSPISSSNGSSSAPATASSCRRPTCPAPTRTSCASSCRSCSAAACSVRICGQDLAREPGAAGPAGGRMARGCTRSGVTALAERAHPRF